MSSSDSSASSASDVSSFSSESSVNVEWFSQVVLVPPVRNKTHVRFSVILDLNLIDDKWAKEVETHYVNCGGVFGSVTVPDALLPIADGQRYYCEFVRQGVTTENIILNLWQEAMLGRIRSALSSVRSIGQTVFTPNVADYRII